MALVCDVYWDFVTFPFGILGQVWYLIVSIHDPCCLSYFYCERILGTSWTLDTSFTATDMLDSWKFDLSNISTNTSFLGLFDEMDETVKHAIALAMIEDRYNSKSKTSIYTDGCAAAATQR